jgi:hypothetical protein
MDLSTLRELSGRPALFLDDGAVLSRRRPWSWRETKSRAETLSKPSRSVWVDSKGRGEALSLADVAKALLGQ